MHIVHSLCSEYTVPVYLSNGKCSLMWYFNFVTEPLSEIEDMLLRDVLPLNLKVDSAPFRQHLVAHLKRLLTRVRDGAIALTKTKDSSALGKTLQFETTGIFFHNLYCSCK